MGFSLLRPSLPLSLKPRQRLIPTTDILATAMVLATATVLATDATTMARGRLRLPPRLRLILPFVWWTEDLRLWSWLLRSWPPCVLRQEGGRGCPLPSVWWILWTETPRLRTSILATDTATTTAR